MTLNHRVELKNSGEFLVRISKSDKKIMDDITIVSSKKVQLK